MQDLKHNINRIFETEKIDQAAPGYVLGIRIKEEVSFYSDGKASLENDLDITKSTKFHLASITKHFTALLFDIIEGEGFLNKEDLLSQHLEDYKLCDKQIRLKHLLSHTSGIRDQWDLTEFGGWAKHD